MRRTAQSYRKHRRHSRPSGRMQLMNVFWLTGFTSFFGSVSSYSTTATDSVVKCKLDALSKSSFESVRVGAHAASKADAALCSDDTNSEAVAESSALSISRTFADAFMGAIVDCYAEGTAHYTINGKSLATAQAYAFAEAFAEASVVSKTCHKCLAASELLAHSYAEIFISAAHEAEVSIEGVANGGRHEDDYTIISQHLVEKTMVAFAQVIVKAQAKVNDCKTSAELKVATGDIDDLNKVQCVVNSAAASDYKVQDACKHAAEDLALSVCDLEDRTSQVLEVNAEAVAKAAATAIAGMSAGCTIEGQGTACAVGFSEITQAATAVAEAYAGAFMSATAECGELCHTDEDDMAAAVGSVLVTAVSNIYNYHCTGPDSYFHIEEVEVQIVEATVMAISQLLAQATVATDDNRMTACMLDMDMASAIAPMEVSTDQLRTANAAGTAAAPPPVEAFAAAPGSPAGAPGPAPEQSFFTSAVGPLGPTPADAPEPFGDENEVDAQRLFVGPSPGDMEEPAPGELEFTSGPVPAPGPEAARLAGEETDALGTASGNDPGPDRQTEVQLETGPGTGSMDDSELDTEVDTSTQLAAAPAPAPTPDPTATSRAASTDGAVGPAIPESEERPIQSGDEARTTVQQAGVDKPQPEPGSTDDSEQDVVITVTTTSTDEEPNNATPEKQSEPHGSIPAEQEPARPQPKPVVKPHPKPAPPRKRPQVALKPGRPGARNGRPSKRPPIRRKPVAQRRRPYRSPARRPNKVHPSKRKVPARAAKQPKRRPVLRRKKLPSKAARGRRYPPRALPKRRRAASQGRRRPASPKRQPSRPRRRVPRSSRARGGRTRATRPGRHASLKQPQKKKGKPGKKRARAPRRTRNK